VPRRPDWDAHVPEARLLALHDRVGRLHRDGEVVGHLHVRVEPYARQLGGRWWWRSWEITDTFRCTSTVDGRREDNLTHHERLEGELRDLQRGLFRYRGDVLAVAWADGADAESLREA
jgi:hypothetical protein